MVEKSTAAAPKISIMKAITGCMVEETKTEWVPGESGESICERTVTQKHIPPDADVVISTLCRLDPDNWKNRVDITIKAKIN